MIRPKQVAGLLGGPRTGWMLRDSEEADAPGRVLDYGQDVSLGAVEQVDCEEVARRVPSSRSTVKKSLATIGASDHLTVRQRSFVLLLTPQPGTGAPHEPGLAGADRNGTFSPFPLPWYRA